MNPYIFDDINDFAAKKNDLIQATGIKDICCEPLSQQDRRKLFMQNLFHEARHQYQTELQLQTEGIRLNKLTETGWANIESQIAYILGRNIESKSEKVELNIYKKIYKLIMTRTWKSMRQNEGLIPKDSELGNQAHAFLEATETYHIPRDVNDIEDFEQYVQNSLERDANFEAYKYVKKRFGDWY